MKIDKKELFGSLPPEWPEDLLPSIEREVKQSNRKIVVLDDDPTGTQTVHNLTVLTRWEVELLVEALGDPGPTVYILTNSRSLPLEQAQELNRAIARNLKQASSRTGRDFVLVSRSDSTLRGHFPGEVEALQAELERPVDGVLVIPFFEEGGRYTVGDVHYVAEGEMLVPAAETEYARDATFGYHSSNLREWVSEKFQGRLQPSEVGSIDLETLRRKGPSGVAEILMGAGHGKVYAVNAAGYRDLEVFVAGLLQAESAGKRFLYRSAASFVRVRSGIRPRPLLTTTELELERGKAGLILAGSYIRKSSQQIEAVRALPGVSSLEIAVRKLIEPAARQEEIERVSEQASQGLKGGDNVLIYTSRELLTGQDGRASLEIGQSISRALVEIVQRIQDRPAWVIAKGGITSSDIATQGLQVSQAEVLGQILPGVPVWRTGAGSRWPGLIYVVFPGNVGGPDAIADVVGKFQ